MLSWISSLTMRTRFRCVSYINGSPPCTGRAFSSFRMTSSSDGASKPMSAAPGWIGPRIGARS